MPFPTYTIPAYQLRRMLADARALNESFQLTYERLPGLVGDEAWRRHAIASTVVLAEDGKKGTKHCKTRAAGSFLWSACAADEIALLPPPTGWLTKLLVSFPYPILPDTLGVDELPCMD